MPYANNHSVRIHYQVEGEGPPLVLQHGFTSSLQNWYAYGYVAALRQNYQLILIDARGHGQSDKPYDPQAYALQHRVEDVLAVLDALQVDNAHYLGYSMGGRIGFGIVKYHPERFLSLMIGGMHPYESPSESANARIALLQQGMAAYVADAETQNGPMAADRKARLLANDPAALIASLQAPRGLAGIEQLLLDMTLPCLLYVGEADSFYPGAQRGRPVHAKRPVCLLPRSQSLADLAGESPGSAACHAVPARCDAGYARDQRQSGIVSEW